MVEYVQTTSKSSAEVWFGRLRLNWGERPWMYDQPERTADDLMLRWPGTKDESVIVVIHQSGGVAEPFHRHDYFYFNYAYKGAFLTYTAKDVPPLVVNEGSICAGQPYSGHSMGAHDDEDTVIVGVLMTKQVVHERLLPFLSPSADLFNFLVAPVSDIYSDVSFCLPISQSEQFRSLLEIMAAEQAKGEYCSQNTLQALAASYLALLSHEASIRGSKKQGEKLRRSDAIVCYIREHPDTATLSSVARVFGYSPTYLSGLLKNEVGRTFSEILTEERMTRAAMLLKGTDLSIEKVASLLGYDSTSSFYRAHRQYFGASPSTQREM